jgi:tRNA(Ile)-lysidine synthase
VHPLAQKVLEYACRLELLRPGDRLGVAVSGGADSVALLRLLLELRSELGIVLTVVHFNHKLRGTESDEDEKFVAELAKQFRLELHVSSGDVRGEAVANRLSIETVAREMRYDFFRSLLEAGGGHRQIDKVATGHTLDDQAETVLMRLVRGTGPRGLSGIYPSLDFQDQDLQDPDLQDPDADEPEAVGRVIRPLLAIRRDEVERLLRELGQPWREDSSNRDPKHTRNRLRHVLLPLLEREFNPAVTTGLGELAEIARGEEDYWNNEISGWMGTAIHWSAPAWAQAGEPQGLVQLQPFNPELQKRMLEPGPLVMNASIDLLWLLSEPLAVQRRAIKAAGDAAGLPLEFKHIEEILRFAAEEKQSGKELSLPLGWKVVREPVALTLVTPDLRAQERIPTEYEYPLALPGRAMVPEAGIVVEALRVPINLTSNDYRSDQLLGVSAVSKELAVRNWRPGDRFWPAHTKAPKKVKELLQERHITGPERRLWPVVVCGDEVVWVRGFPASAPLQPQDGAEEAILIRDEPLEDE